MRLGTAICLSLVLTIGFAGNIEEHDGLQACISDCGGLIKLYAKCEHQTDGDSAFKNCVCKDGNAESAFNSCAACAKKKGCTANEQNDLAELMQGCGLDFDAAKPTPTDSSIVVATTTITSGSTAVPLTRTLTRSAGSQSTATAASTTDGTAEGAAATAGEEGRVAGLAFDLIVEAEIPECIQVLNVMVCEGRLLGA